MSQLCRILKNNVPIILPSLPFKDCRTNNQHQQLSLSDRPNHRRRSRSADVNPRFNNQSEEVDHNKYRRRELSEDRLIRERKYSCCGGSSSHKSICSRHRNDQFAAENNFDPRDYKHIPDDYMQDNKYVDLSDRPNYDNRIKDNNELKRSRENINSNNEHINKVWSGNENQVGRNNVEYDPGKYSSCRQLNKPYENRTPLSNQLFENRTPLSNSTQCLSTNRSGESTVCKTKPLRKNQTVSGYRRAEVIVVHCLKHLL